MQRVFLICGVPGSGKTWVCTQLEDKFTYVPHDDYPQRVYPVEIFNHARTSDKPILADCPFAERVLREELIARGIRVVPVFIVEDPDTCRARYEERDQRDYPASHFTRASSIGARAAEWKAFRGTSKEVLEYLKEVPYA